MKAIKLLHFISSKKEARKLDQNYKVWQDGFHPIGLQSEYFYQQKLNYIHENPVRKKYVRKPEHWFYSSARNYDVAMPIDELY